MRVPNFMQDPPNIYFYGLLQFPNSTPNGTPDQESDSGGPVFCYSCYPRVVTPAGLIEDQQGSTYTYALQRGSVKISA